MWVIIDSRTMLSCNPSTNSSRFRTFGSLYPRPFLISYCLISRNLISVVFFTSLLSDRSDTGLTTVEPVSKAFASAIFCAAMRASMLQISPCKSVLTAGRSARAKSLSSSSRSDEKKVMAYVKAADTQSYRTRTWRLKHSRFFLKSIVANI